MSFANRLSHIKIRYKDLSPGLHADPQVEGSWTIIYLLPGLTPEQRRAALRRVRQASRMGIGPRLPAAPVAMALAADRIRMTIRDCMRVVRRHPAGSVVPIVLLSAMMAIYLLLSVSIRVLHPQLVPGHDPALGTNPTSPAFGSPDPGSSPMAGQAGSREVGTRKGGSSVAAGTSRGASGQGAPGAGTVAQSGTGTSGSGTAGSGTSGSGTSSTGGSSSGGVTLTAGGSGATLAPTAAPPAVTLPTASPSPTTPSPSPSPTSSSGAGLCLDVGPLGICLSV
jgi:hypothetical protein